MKVIGMLTCYAHMIIPINKNYDICDFINKKTKENLAKRYIIYKSRQSS